MCAPETLSTGSCIVDKKALLDRIQNTHAQVEALIVGLSDEQMLHRTSDQLWSFADTVAHLTFWQQSMVTNLQRYDRGEPMAHLGGQLDDINAQVFAANASRPPALVLSEFRHAYTQLLECLQALTDDDLNGTTVPFRDEEPLYEYILGESAEHFEEHINDLRAARERALVDQ
jgi:hypothetical protein